MGRWRSYPRAMGDSQAELDRQFLDMAARGALRALGDVEPNPLVGAALVKDGEVVGLGHHRRFGGPHAEREALANATHRGLDPRGSTLYCTLEPCTHHGKTPPCTDAILKAGIARVVIARPDPNPAASGGADVLRARGLDVRFSDASPLASALSEPFIRRTTTGLPFVIAKWAQTLDGRIATRTSDSKWISCERSRRRVHRLRARVDAILTGAGTVVADDPMLTARGVRIHRVARRIVLDSALRTPVGCTLVRTARQTPTTILYSSAALAHSGEPGRIEALRKTGVELISVPAGPNGLDLRAALRSIAAQGVQTVLLEAGPSLLGALLSENLVDRALVYVAPILLADGEAKPVAIGRSVPVLAEASRWSLVRAKRVDHDLELLYRRSTPDGAAR